MPRDEESCCSELDSSCISAIGGSRCVLAVRNMLLLKRLKPLSECPGLGVCTSSQDGAPVCALKVSPQQGPVYPVPQPYGAGDGLQHYIGLDQDGMMVRAPNLSKLMASDGALTQVRDGRIQCSTTFMGLESPSTVSRFL